MIEDAKLGPWTHDIEINQPWEMPPVTPPEQIPEKRKKFNYVGAPAIFALETACQDINRAFSGFGRYIVGSALERPDWRGVDVRYIMDDEEFDKLFPDVGHEGHWESDPRWLLLTVSISERLAKVTGLPVDFQFQPQTHANKAHKGKREPVGMIMAKRDKTP